MVEGFHAALLDAMRNARALGPRGRERRLRPAMQAAFDLPAMTRIAVGPPWTGVGRGRAASLGVAPSPTGWWRPTPTASTATPARASPLAARAPCRSGDRLVRTQLLRPNDAPVRLNYLLRGGEGRWRVVDIYLDGTVSELATRRAEFTTLLREGGAERLVAELRRRTGALLGGG